METVRGLLPAIRDAIASGSSSVSSLISQAKIACLDFPSQKAADPFQLASPEEQSLTRELLELSITDMVPKGDWQQFERSLAQLLPLYSPSSGGVGKMETRRLVMGLQLMHLLVEARLADFHCCVETLLAEDATHPLIAYPLKLEAYLLEGRYNKIVSLNSAPPHPLFKHFLARLEGTLRDDIADCAAAAYPSLSVVAACKMLSLEGGAEALRKYAEGRGLSWVIQGGTLRFTPSDGGGKDKLPDSKSILSKALGYAAELERIV